MEITNSLRDLKGSISLRALETGSGFRFFFDDDEESYFDLNLEKMAADPEEFEFQISFSPLPAAGFSGQHPAADELLRNGRILPSRGPQVVEARGSPQVPIRYGEQQVYPEEMLLPVSSTPADEGAAGGLNQKGQLDPSSEKGQGLDSVRQCMEDKNHHQGPAAGTRKTPKATAKKTHNGVTNFLIRFPSEKIRSTFMSIMRSYHLPSLHSKRGGRGEGGTQERAGRMYYCKRLVMQFSRWLALGKRSHNESSKSGKNSATSAAPQRGRDVDLDEDVIRSILEAVDFAVGSTGSRGGAAARGSGGGGPRRSNSSPRVSRKGVVEGAVERNSSISSAIAHCKMSYNGSTARLVP